MIGVEIVEVQQAFDISISFRSNCQIFFDSCLGSQLFFIENGIDVMAYILLQSVATLVSLLTILILNPQLLLRIRIVVLARQGFDHFVEVGFKQAVLSDAVFFEFGFGVGFGEFRGDFARVF